MFGSQVHVQLNGTDETVILDPVREPRLPRNSSTGIHNNNSTSTAFTMPPTMSPTLAPEVGYTIWGSPFINESMHTLIVSILIALIVVLSIILFILLMPLFRRTLRRRAATDKRRIKKRLQTVDAWLITKNVREHNDRCHHESTETDAHDDDEESGRECMICMEEFRVGTPVSWSPNEHCRHVYHKECIREWLIRHSDCPYCRRHMLPIDDGNGGRLLLPQLRVMADQRMKRFAETSYCLDHGFVEHKPKHKPTSPCRTVSTSRSSNSDGETVEEVDEEMGCENCIKEESESEKSILEDVGSEKSKDLCDMSERSIEEEMGIEPPLPPLDEDNDEEVSVTPQDEPLPANDV